MNEPRRHHLVPQFYLRRFSKDDRVLLVSRDDLRRRFPSSIKKALVQCNFYSLEFDGEKDLTVERMLDTEVESPASRAISRVVDTRRSTTFPALRRAISRFLAFQVVRGDATRESKVAWYRSLVRHIGKIATPEMVREELARQGDVVSIEEAQEIADFAKDESLQVDLGPASNLHLRSALQNALDIIPFFERRNWVLLEFEQPSLITCDEPVALIGDPTCVGELTGVGTAGEIVFATDPCHALVLVHPDKGAREGRSQGTAAMADLINRHVSFSAHRYIVCHPDCVPLQGMTLPRKAEPVMVLGNLVVSQPRVSVDARRRWLDNRKWPFVR